MGSKLYGNIARSAVYPNQNARDVSVCSEGSTDVTLLSAIVRRRIWPRPRSHTGNVLILWQTRVPAKNISRKRWKTHFKWKVFQVRRGWLVCLVPGLIRLLPAFIPHYLLRPKFIKSWSKSCDRWSSTFELVKPAMCSQQLGLSPKTISFLTLSVHLSFNILHQLYILQDSLRFSRVNLSHVLCLP